MDVAAQFVWIEKQVRSLVGCSSFVPWRDPAFQDLLSTLLLLQAQTVKCILEDSYNNINNQLDATITVY